MLSWLKTKKQLIAFSLVLLISSLGIFVLGAKDAQANYVVDGLKSVFGDILLAIQGGIGYLVVQLAGLGLGIMNFTNPQTASLVQSGWRVTRDLANMFFVLILLAIAFATILRVETYGMKALLPKLIIAALLINFSLVFAGVIIDFSGVLTNFFVDDGQEFFKNIADSIRLPKIMTTTAEKKIEGWQCNLAGNYLTKGICESIAGGNCAPVACTPIIAEAKIKTETDWKKVGDDYWAVISSLFFSIIFTVVAAFVFGALAFLLLARILIIWFLLILAPLAWFFWILPATRHLFTQWWQTFIKWVFFAPAAIFFIWLSVNSWLGFIQGEIPSSGGKAVEGMKQIVSDDILGSRLVPQIMEPKNFVQFLLACGMLFGSLIVAQKMGIYGASGALGVAKWFGKGAAGIANRWAAGAPTPLSGLLTKGLRKVGWEKGARGLERFGAARQKVTPYVSPGVWRRGWVARREETEREAYRLSAPAMQDKLTGVFSLGKEKSDYLERAKRAERIEEEKKIVTTNSEELTGGFKKSMEAGLPQKAAAYAMKSAAQGDLNDLIGKVGPGYDFNAEGISKFTEEQLKPLLGEQDAYRLGHDLNKSLEKTGQWPGRVFKSEYDKKTGKTTYKNLVKELGPEAGTKEALGEANKAWSRLEPQERARFTHRLGFISESKGVPPDVPPQDIGIKGHEMWISGLPAKHADRIPDEVIGTLMFRHSDETKELNPELHKKLSEILSTKMPEQRQAMKDMIKEVAEKDEKGREIPTNSWSPEETEPSSTVSPTKESFKEARAKSPPGAFG